MVEPEPSRATLTAIGATSLIGGIVVGAEVALSNNKGWHVIVGLCVCGVLVIAGIWTLGAALSDRVPFLGLQTRRAEHQEIADHLGRLREIADTFEVMSDEAVSVRLEQLFLVGRLLGEHPATKRKELRGWDSCVRGFVGDAWGRDQALRFHLVKGGSPSKFVKRRLTLLSELANHRHSMRLRNEFEQAIDETPYEWEEPLERLVKKVERRYRKESDSSDDRQSEQQDTPSAPHQSSSKSRTESQTHQGNGEDARD